MTATSVTNHRTVADLIRAVGSSNANLVSGSADVKVLDITNDSRSVESGSMFCCVRGLQRDGHEFAGIAVERGAVALLVDHRLDKFGDVAQVRVGDVRAAIGSFASEVFANPSRHMSVVGVTGTNGKTTTAHLLGSILRTSGVSTDVIGTLSGTLTTPEASDLQRNLASRRAEGTQSVVMEVSSHALSLDRVLGTSFALAIFTNLGRDHLDFHGTQDAYFEAKARLFEPDLARVGVVNADDPFGRRLIDRGSIPIIPFSVSDVADVEVSATAHSYTWHGQQLGVAMGGSLNLMNSLAAATAARELGVDLAAIAEGLRVAPVVSGRFEHVDAGQAFVVLVDFAHTPDGLGEMLRSVRQATTDGRVIVVFGCGGDRDKMKRPIMGETAATLADAVVVTSDNPRSEDPEAIIASIVAGVPDHLRRRLIGIEANRREAMSLAFRHAREGDVVVIAGKGHERTQTIGDEVVDFDDRVVARELLEALR
jgi:UDP-N-acetylmuramoyl-L-alanyl-D-glutamate--2,6-diaminopimelate ligase